MNELAYPPENDLFWMIIRKQGGNAPAKRHYTFDEAIKEAERLTRQTNEVYYLLRTIGKVKPKETPLEYERINFNDPRP